MESRKITLMILFTVLQGDTDIRIEFDTMGEERVG